jgi:decaprenylphospho-beta-D-erythro-pentofuranosid-2-ulose 2-reductase
MTVATVRSLLLIGGSSEIGAAIARRLADDGPLRVYLLGRDRARMEQTAATLEASGCVLAGIGEVDAADPGTHERAVTEATAQAGPLDVVVLAVGVLGAQQGLDADPATAVEVMDVNFTGAGSLALHALRALRAQGRGSLVVLSSVAAERPRRSNAVYGAAKAGLDALAQGLADETAGTGVRVLVVRPGFVTTRMTSGLEPTPMATSADQVANATVRALATGAHTIWVPGRLRLLFAVLRHLPRAVWRRLPI